MRFAFICLSLVLLSVSTKAQTTQFETWGSGNESCATWLATPLSEINAEDWIFGFWSGENLGISLNGSIGNVGHTTDALGIIGEVKKVCTNTPSMSLATAVSKVFFDFSKANK